MMARTMLATTVLLLATACGGKQTPHELATMRVARGVEVAASAPSGPATLAVRYNPVDRCDCPEFEVFAYGGWTRAFIAPEERVAALRHEAHAEVRGEFTARRVAPNGVRYRVLQLQPVLP